MEIIIKVNNQRMHPTDNIRGIVEGSQNFVKFKFELGEDWSGLTVFAQFSQDETGYNQYLDNDNCVYLPPEIVKGECKLVLYGNGGSGNSAVRATTNCLRLVIGENSLVEDIDSIEITRSLYDQLVSRVQASASGTPLIANTAADMTDTSRIYVYIGNETGYSNGSWYYNDGGTWTAGGDYVGAPVEVATVAETLDYINS